MQTELGFIVRVLKISPKILPLGQPEFLGTAIVIAPDQILTCRHVVVERDIRGLYAEAPIDTEHLLIQYGNNAETIAPRDIITDTRWDLALLTLPSPITPAGPAFLHEVTWSHSSYLKECELQAFGYPGMEDGESLRRQPVSAKMPSFQTESNRLADLQLEGGLPAGCSGGPVLMEFQDRLLCLGIIYLGGEKSGSSRLIAADTIVAFLHKHGVEPSALVDAQQVLVPTPTTAENTAKRATSSSRRLSLGKHLMISLALATAVLSLSLTSVFQRLDYFFIDSLFAMRGPLQSPKEIVLVKIDEPSIAELDKTWPWPRDAHAELVKTLFQAGAKTLVFDIIFSESSQPQMDQHFAEVLTQYPDVVLAAQLDREESAFGLRRSWIEPIPLLATANPQIGFTNLVSRSGAIRSFTPQIEDRYSLSYMAAESFTAHFPDQYPFFQILDPATNSMQEIEINFVGPAGMMTSVSYYQALTPERFLASNVFKNKLVFVGATTNVGNGDVFQTPLSTFDSHPMHGVEIHANAAYNLLYGKDLKRFSQPLLSIISLALAMAFSLLFFRLTSLRGGMLLIATTIIIFSTAIALFNYQTLYLPLISLLLPVSTVFLLSVVLRYRAFYRSEQRISVLEDLDKQIEKVRKLR